MEWISVNDRLPAIDSCILAFGSPHENMLPQDRSCIAVVFYGYDERNDEHYFELLSSGCGCCDTSMDNVTHWMSLPNPPKVTSDNLPV